MMWDNFAAESFEIFKETDKDKREHWYLKATYLGTTTEGKVTKRITFPKLELFLDRTMSFDYNPRYFDSDVSVIQLGESIKGFIFNNDPVYIEEILEKRMTLEEIEQALGYEVELVEKTCTTCKFNKTNSLLCKDCKRHYNYVPKEES